MKSCLGLLLALTLMILVMGGGVLIWYLSESSEFSRLSKASVPVPVEPLVTISVRLQPSR